MLVADGVPAERTVTVHEGIDVEHVLAAPPVNVHEAFWLPHQRAGRRQRRRARAAQGPAPSHRSRAPRRARDARRALRHPRRRRAARASRAAGARAPSREARAAARLPHRRARLHQGLRPVRDELGHRRPRHVAARRDGLLQAIVATRAGGIPEVVEDGVTGCSSPRDHHATGGGDRDAAEGRGAAAADGRGRLRARARAIFTVERMVERPPRFRDAGRTGRVRLAEPSRSG